MATKIVTKNSSTASAVPTASDLVQGELAVNVADKRLFTEDNGGSIVELGTNPSTLTVTGEITANGGIDVDGTATMDGLTVENTASAVARLETTDTSVSLGQEIGALEYSQADGSGAGAGVKASIRAKSGNSTGAQTYVAIHASSSSVNDLEVLRVDHTGIDVNGTASATNVSLPDDGVLSLGTSDELTLKHHNSGYSHLINTTGTLYVDSDSVTFRDDDGSPSNMVISQTGIYVDGTATFNSGNENVVATFTSTDTEAQINLVDSTGSAQIRSRNDLRFFVNGGSTRAMDIGSSGDISFYEDTGTTAKFFWDASAETLGLSNSSPSSTYSIDALKPLRVKGTAPSYELEETDSSNQRWSLFGLGGNFTLRDISNGTYPITVESGTPNNTLYLDDSGNVGIGTSSPDTALEVKGDGSSVQVSSADYDVALLGRRGSSGTDLDKGYMRLRDTGTTKVAIDSAGNTYFNGGNVGIGTSSPDAKLVVSKGGSTAAHGDSDLLVRDSSASGSTAQVQILGGNAAYSNLYFSDTDSYSVGGFQYNHSSNYLSTRVNNAEAMRIDSSGNVGIGTSSPNTPLQVSGGNSSTNADALFSIQKTTEGYGLFGGVLPNGASWLQGGTSNDATDYSIVLQPNGGNVGIGTSSPLKSLHVNSGISNIGVRVESSDTTSSIEFIDSGTASTALSPRVGGISNDFFVQTNGAERMRINSSGNVGIGTSSPATDLHIKNTGSTQLLLESGNTDTGFLLFGDAQDSNIGSVSYNHSDNSMRFETDDSERMRIDSSGNLLVGKTASGSNTVGFETSSNGQSISTTNGSSSLILNRKTSDGTIADFRKDGSSVGSIGTASGSMYIEGSPATGKAGLTFYGSSIEPRDTGAPADNAVDLGASGARFKDIYATNGTIQTSDRNEKQDIEELSEAEQRVAVTAKGLLRKFRWKDSVANKGDDARIHFGIIAQDLQDAFEAEGLDAGDYAMFISTTWTDEETNEEKTRMGVRYSELLAFIISAL